MTYATIQMNVSMDIIATQPTRLAKELQDEISYVTLVSSNVRLDMFVHPLEPLQQDVMRFSRLKMISNATIKQLV